MKFSYSFSLTPPKPSTPKEETHQYAYNEFLLELPLHWRQIPRQEDNSFTFQSDSLGASIIVSIDFYEVSADKAQQVAEKCIESRLGVHESAAPGRVVVLQKGIKPHSGGIGLEMNYAAETPGEHFYAYVGFVTSRKIINFSLVCQPDRSAAIALFNQTVVNFRPKLP